MSLVLQREAPPPRRDAAGALRIGNSRVLLELVIRAFEDGATPETINQQYPTTSLADLYSAIAYYLRHRSEIDAYLADREQQAREVRNRIDDAQADLAEVRHRLLARKPALAA